MEFIIKELNKSTTTDGYEVVVTTKIGDADGENSLRFGIFTDSQTDLLRDLIETCERMKSLYPHGKWGMDGYENVEGYKRWFCEYDEDEGESWYGKIEELSPMYYPFRDGEYPDSFEEYNIYYYKDGRKYDVEVKF